MEMHQVRYFLAVAQTMNFTRAAEQCHVAQPSLTRAIKLLEEELGGDLFRRERKLTHLTEFGQRMLPFLRKCHESAQTAKTLAKTIRTGALAPLPVAVSRSVEFAILTPVLIELARAFPGLELKFVRGDEAEVSAALKKGDVEIAVAGPVSERWERLDCWPLFVEPLMAFVSPGHRFANLDAVEPAALAAERILLRPYCATSDDARKFLGADVVVRSHEVAGDDDVVKMIEAGLGVGIMPASAACPAAVRKIALRGGSLERAVLLYSVAGRERSAACAALMKMLRARDWAKAPR